MYCPTHNRLLSVTLIALAALLVNTAATADELLLRDGSRILGEVVKRSNGTLEFSTKSAGTLMVQWSEVAELKTDKPMEFLLTDESLVEVGHVTNNVDDMVVEGVSGLPPQTLGQDVIDSINPEPWQKGEGRKFTGIVNFAFSRQRGNTDQDETDWDTNMTLRGKDDRFNLFGELENQATDNDTTAENWKLEGTYDYFYLPKWFTGAFVRLEHDKFADLDRRTSLGPQIGYQWFESKELNLRTASGIAYVDEKFDVAEDDSYIALPWSVDFDTLVFGTTIQFYHKQTGFWDLEDTSNVILDTWTGLRFPLLFGLVASTELQADYDSGAPAGVKEWDTTYSLKLGYQW
jgi:putative salt-induced outer membrane protein YdiY